MRFLCDTMLTVNIYRVNANSDACSKNVCHHYCTTPMYSFRTLSQKGALRVQVNNAYYDEQMVNNSKYSTLS